MIEHGIDIQEVLEELANEEIQEDEVGNRVRRIYLGTIFYWYPSGKCYAPWAISVLDSCPVCEGKGTLPNPQFRPEIHAAAQKEHYALLAEIREEGRFPKDWTEEERELIDYFVHLQEKHRDTLECERCYSEEFGGGCGSAEAADDERWRKAAEEALGEHGLYLESGEGDPCDLYICQIVEEEEEEDSEEVPPTPTTAAPVDEIIAYENGELDEEGVISLFQRLIDCGLAWTLQGHYGRTAHALIEAGYCTP